MPISCGAGLGPAAHDNLERSTGLTTAPEQEVQRLVRPSGAGLGPAALGDTRRLTDLNRTARQIGDLSESRVRAVSDSQTDAQPTIWTAGRSPVIQDGSNNSTQDEVREIRVALYQMQQEMQQRMLQLQQRLLNLTLRPIPNEHGLVPPNPTTIEELPGSEFDQQERGMREIASRDGQCDLRQAVNASSGMMPTSLTTTLTTSQNGFNNTQGNQAPVASLPTVNETRTTAVNGREVLKGLSTSVPLVTTNQPDIPSGLESHAADNRPVYNRPQILQHNVPTGATDVGPSICPPDQISDNPSSSTVNASS